MESLPSLALLFCRNCHPERSEGSLNICAGWGAETFLGSAQHSKKPGGSVAA